MPYNDIMHKYAPYSTQAFMQYACIKFSTSLATSVQPRLIRCCLQYIWSSMSPAVDKRASESCVGLAKFQ
jgi:hypothetical protein